MIEDYLIEKACIGAIVKSPDLLADTSLKDKHFSNKANRELFKEVSAQIEEKGEVDVVLLSEMAYNDYGIKVEAFQRHYMTNSSVDNFKSYEKSVVDKWIKDRFVNTVNSNVQDVLSSKDPIAAIREISSNLELLVSDDYSDVGTHISEFTKEAIGSVQSAMLSDGISGITTGIPKLNLQTGGWQKSDLIILAGRPAMGKTTFALNLFLRAIESDKPIVFYSLEMTPTQLIHVLANAIAGIRTQDLRSGSITQSQMDDYETFVLSLNSMPIYIVDNCRTVEAISRSMFFHKRKYGIELAVVDHLHLVRTEKNHKSDEQKYGYITSMLKETASRTKCDIPIILLAQLNRGVDNRENKRPNMSDLRSSGAIEQDADIIMFLYRDSYYTRDTSDNSVELIIAKNRMGDIGIIELEYKNRKYNAKENFF